MDSALAMTASIGAGTSCRYSRSSGAGFEMRCERSCCGVSPTNGGTPAIASYSTQASEYTSLRPSKARSRACSGLMYAGVPVIVPCA